MIDVSILAQTTVIKPGHTVAKLPKKQIEQAVEEFVRRQVEVPIDAVASFNWNLDQDRPYRGPGGLPPSATVTFTHQLMENKNA